MKDPNLPDENLPSHIAEPIRNASKASVYEPEGSPGEIIEREEQDLPVDITGDEPEHEPEDEQEAYEDEVNKGVERADEELRREARMNQVEPEE